MRDGADTPAMPARHFSSGTVSFVASLLAFLLTYPALASPSPRSCTPPQLDVAKLYAKNPREVRGLLSPTLGPPVVETNQLPDGGSFARLDVADQQDGVSQRFAWGGSEGSVEIVYQRGRAHLVSVRLEEYETIVRSRSVQPCKPWPKEALAGRAGLKLPKKPSNTRQAQGQMTLRFDIQANQKKTADWVVRMRCAGNDSKCVDVSVYFPLHVPPGEESHASTQQQLQLTGAVATTPIAPPAPAPAARSRLDLGENVAVSGARRPLKSN